MGKNNRRQVRFMFRWLVRARAEYEWSSKSGSWPQNMKQPNSVKLDPYTEWLKSDFVRLSVAAHDAPMLRGTGFRPREGLGWVGREG